MWIIRAWALSYRMNQCIVLIYSSSQMSNTTTHNYARSPEVVGFVGDPNGRGTSSLVISCLSTLILCVWSALHLNVPVQNETKFRSLWLNVRWIIAGIYAPELVVFTAWRQWSSARILQQVVSKALRDPSNPLSQKGNTPEWTMIHSFFACAGGFALELDNLRDATHDQPQDEATALPRLTVTARGIALMSRCGYLPHVDRNSIEDKSKANDMAKGVVLIQAFWMLVQVVGRLAFRLPVTLLEVNTVAHVLCAFAMYLFWWHKPLLPNHPIIITDNQLVPLAAWMYASSEMSGYVNPERRKSQTLVKTFFASLSLYSKTPELETISLQSRVSIEEPAKEAVVLDSSCLLDSTLFRFKEASEACITELKTMREKEKGTAFFERRPKVLDRRPSSASKSQIDNRRWSFLQEALNSHSGLLDDRILLSHIADGRHCVHLKPEPLVATYIKNWPSDDLLRNVDGLVVGMILWLANFCYGGIHAAAWNDFFPSEAEKWLWRSSAAYIGFCGGLWVILNFSVTRSPKLNEFWEKWMDGEKTWFESFGLGLVVFTCGFSLILARLYVVVEAFLSIRQLPIGAYDTPQWTNVFPHF
ncbi:hypothetical protein F5Y16DRAFT_264878 [Xylariaceae sp. FL0255]|nr:hypothetical protein F5Y16DRAFT_264878 [Xylariaceae sp. FL0255]